jgi:UDP-GlcNAc3NAcA epimerase
VRIVSVVGTRPQLIKAAALSPALRARHSETLIDTGQHWDEAMAGAFFAELALPRPDRSLGIHGGASADQIGRMLPALAAALAAEGPDAVLVFGDTNSTLAGALAATTLGLPIAHVEAGLRSFDRRMPEEVNRVLVDHLARWLFAPARAAATNLENEGIHRGVTVVGDVMQDLAASVVPSIRGTADIDALRLNLSPGRYLFATIHRAENRQPAAVALWAESLSAVARRDRPVVLALHPGTRFAMDAVHAKLATGVHIIDPQPYKTTLALQLHAAAVITDSGGIQREAGWLTVPCLVLRRTTEWVEAVADSEGRMVLVGNDPKTLVAEVSRLAPSDTSVAIAIERAARVQVPRTGSSEAIAGILAARWTGQAGT